MPKLNSTPDLAREPWERQPGEPMRAFKAFTIYRDLGPHRTLKAAAAGFYINEHEDAAQDATRSPGRKKGDRRTSSVERWSAKYHWVERVSRWDGELDRVARAEQVEAVKKMVDRHAMAGVIAVNKAIEKLVATSGTQLTVSEAIRLLEVGVKTERAARGEPEDTLGISGPGGGPVTVTVSTGMKAALDRIDRAAASTKAADGRVVEA